MKIICTKENLMKGINIVQKAVPTRTTMSILECILIDASTNVIKLTANDMELAIETTVEGEIEERGIIALDAKFFADLIRNLDEGDVRISSDEKMKTKITCGKASYDIVGKPGDDFARIPVIPRNNPIVISQFSLREVIRQTIFSTANNDSNKIMTGELFEIKENNLQVVSLDGHRVSIRNIELKENNEYKKVIVPGKTLNEISKIINGNQDDQVNIFITDNHIIFEFDKTIVVSRLLEGEFFKIDQMLATSFSSKVKINKKSLMDCLSRAMPLIKEGDKKPIIMNISDNNVSISLKATAGSMNEDIEIVKEGKDQLIGFNPQFILDALRVIDEEEINIYMVNGRAPAFIKDDNESFIYMVLPVNFNVA